MKHRLLAAAVPALLIAGAVGAMPPKPEGSEAGRDAAAISGMDMTPTERGGYVQLAGASDMFEIESSRLALRRSRTPEVREYAQMLIEHHQRSTRQVMAAARAANMKPRPPRLTTMQSGMMRNLQRANARSFDVAYLRAQIPAHEMALALHQNYAQNGDEPQLKAVAAGIVPVVQQHLDRARQLGANR